MRQIPNLKRPMKSIQVMGQEMLCYLRLKLIMRHIIANAQNICNLIGREGFNNIYIYIYIYILYIIDLLLIT